jgi:hypothetical protein
MTNPDPAPLLRFAEVPGCYRITYRVDVNAWTYMVERLSDDAHILHGTDKVPVMCGGLDDVESKILAHATRPR